MTKTLCPGCKHVDTSHAGGFCYACGYCGWSILGEGNAWGLSAGWHQTEWDAYFYRNPGTAWWDE